MSKIELIKTTATLIPTKKIFIPTNATVVNTVDLDAEAQSTINRMRHKNDIKPDKKKIDVTPLEVLQSHIITNVHDYAFSINSEKIVITVNLTINDIEINSDAIAEIIATKYATDDLKKARIKAVKSIKKAVIMYLTSRLDISKGDLFKNSHIVVQSNKAPCFEFELKYNDVFSVNDLKKTLYNVFATYHNDKFKILLDNGEVDKELTDRMKNQYLNKELKKLITELQSKITVNGKAVYIQERSFLTLIKSAYIKASSAGITINIPQIVTIIDGYVKASLNNRLNEWLKIAKKEFK